MKNIPIGLMSASLCLWGWQTGLWIFAIILAICLEGSRLIKIRLEISVEHFKWIADLCTVLMIGIAIYLALNHSADQFIYSLMRYLPLIVSPMVLAQIYSTSDKIDIRAISLISRRSRRNIKPLYINSEYPFLALVAISASFSPEKNLLFYPAFLLVAGGGLYKFRNRRYSAVIWIGYFLLLSVVGFAGSVGLNNLQLFLERNADFFSDIESSDPFHSVTAIGHVGELKSSDKIIFRVKPEIPQQLPILLREAAYDQFYKNEWFAVSSDFKQVRASEKNSWILGIRPKSPKQITILTSFQYGKGLLKLPVNSVRILNLPAENVTRNRFGAVYVRGAPGYAEYHAEYGETGLAENFPGDRDMQIPEDNEPILKEISEKLEIYKLSPKEAVKRLERFFEKNFTYSLKNTQKNPDSIRNFLQVSRSGHCEYFATVGVLLLRQAGIPARYAVGFSAHEWSDRENQAVVRARHAHAWTLAWIDGKWIDADFTPSTWRESENETISKWHWLADMWDYAAFLFQQWRWQKTDVSAYALWLIVPLVLILGRRFLLLRKTRKVRKTAIADATALKHHIASPFDRVVEFLQHQGYIRLSGESLKTWIRRISSEHILPNAESDLMVLVNLHYRLRFDPHGITSEEYQILEKGSELWK